MQQIILPIYRSIIFLHEIVIEVSGGKEGIRDDGNIQGAVGRPKTYLAYHPDCDLHTVCAVLLDSIARNHGFIEGNKRTGLMTVLYTYRMNGVFLKFDLFSNKDYEELALWVVLSKPTIPQIAERLQELANKHKATGIDTLAQKLKGLFYPEE